MPAAADVLAELEALGTEQNRKIYGRHGVTEPLFGVSYGNLAKIRKQLRVDHGLAQSLFETGVHDAQILAAQIADPDALTVRVADAWIRAADNYVLMEAVAAAVAASPIGRRRGEVWRGRKAEYVRAAGWSIAAHHAVASGGMENEEAEALVEEIRTTIHDQANRVRHEMNGVLLAVGLRNDHLLAIARRVAAEIGVVEVDHGQTNCKTPDAVDYLDRAVAAGRAGRAERSR